MKKKAMLCAAAGLIALLTACPTGSEPDPEPEPEMLYTQEFWGEWLRTNPDETWYISGDVVTVNGSPRANVPVLRKASEQVIQADSGGAAFYLYASRQADAVFTGTVILDDDLVSSEKARAVKSPGEMQITIEHIKNAADKQKVPINNDGTFTASHIISNDDYEISFADSEGNPVTAQPSIVITPQTPDEDMGTFHVGEGFSFKAAIKPKTGVDMTELYVEEYYDFTLEISNTGTGDIAAGTYDYSLGSNGLQIAGFASGFLPAIPRGGKGGFNISLSCAAVQGPSEVKKVDITVSAGGKTWTDTVSLRFNREPLEFTLRSAAAIEAVLIPEDTKSRSIKTLPEGDGTYAARVSVPWTTKPYTLVLSAPASDTGYAVGVNRDPGKVYAGFTDANHNEPNNTEQNATLFYTEERTVMVSYLSGNDIDCYTIRTGAEPPSKMEPIKTDYDAGTEAELAAALAGIRDSDIVDSGFTINITANFSASLMEISGNGFEHKTISIRSKNSAVHEIALNQRRSLFTIRNGTVTLILENIIFKGLSDNDSPLVMLYSGNLVLKQGGKISGNTAYSGDGGGVYFGGSGTFTMSSGEISGNTSYSGGGGVYATGEMFTMSGGEISGNTSSS